MCFYYNTFSRSRQPNIGQKNPLPKHSRTVFCVAAVYRRRDWIVYRFGFVQVNSTQAEPITLEPLPDALTRILIVL